MEIQVNTAKKYDYKLTIKLVDYKQHDGKMFQVFGRYVKENGDEIYNTTVKYFKNKAAAIRFYRGKMLSVKY